MMGVDKCWPCNSRTNTGRMNIQNCKNDSARVIKKKKKLVVRFSLSQRFFSDFFQNRISESFLPFFPSVTVVIVSSLSSQNTRTSAQARREE